MQNFFYRLLKKSGRCFAFKRSGIQRREGSSPRLTRGRSRKGQLLTFMTSNLAAKAAFSMNFFHNPADQEQSASVVPLSEGPDRSTH
jgi:hypothetical protein